MTWNCEECYSQKQLCEDCAMNKYKEYPNCKRCGKSMGLHTLQGYCPR